MTATNGYCEMIVELLEPLGRIHVRRMFGGAGVYADGLMFGLISDDTLFLKADTHNQPTFKAAVMRPFVYTAKGKSFTMSYWQVPEGFVDEPERMLTFARAAVGAAQRAAATKQGARRSGEGKKTRAAAGLQVAGQARRTR